MVDWIGGLSVIVSAAASHRKSRERVGSNLNKWLKWVGRKGMSRVETRWIEKSGMSNKCHFALEFAVCASQWCCLDMVCTYISIPPTDNVRWVEREYIKGNIIGFDNNDTFHWS